MWSLLNRQFKPASKSRCRANGGQGVYTNEWRSKHSNANGDPGELPSIEARKNALKKVRKPGSGNARGGPKKKRKKKGKRSVRFDGLQIRHFADTVTYDLKQFLIKNMQAMHPDTAKMIRASIQQHEKSP